MIQPRKACNYPNLRSFGWGLYDKVGVLYSGKLGNRSEARSEARASDLRSYPGLWWNRIKLRLYEGKESEYSPRTCSIGRPAGSTLCPPPITLQLRRRVKVFIWSTMLATTEALRYTVFWRIVYFSE